MPRHYCISFICGSDEDCAFECVGCQFLYDCEFCNNENCEHHGKSEADREDNDDDDNSHT